MEIIRAFSAFSVDWIVCVFINCGVNYVTSHYFVKFIYSDVLQVELLKWLLYALYFVVFPKIWKKQTIGNALVKVRIVSDKEGQSKVTVKELIYRNIILYLAEPMMVLISIILIVSTASCYTEAGFSNFERSIFTLACIIYFPIVFVIWNWTIAQGNKKNNMGDKFGSGVDCQESSFFLTDELSDITFGYAFGIILRAMSDSIHTHFQITLYSITNVYTILTLRGIYLMKEFHAKIHKNPRGMI